MAITKVMHMKASEKAKVDIHLEHAINYILQPKKLGNENLAAGINCLLGSAYKQMKETKKMFGKMGGRQGYHFVISLKPGEGTPQIMYDIATRFAEEAFRGEYEAVIAVHTDKPHLHAHIVINSVNMINGYKFQYHDGDWKYRFQPITNKLCEEYRLGITPAEYSEAPKNVPRTEWALEQEYVELIKEHVNYCAMQAENLRHFLFLMKSLGYDIKDGKHISVKAQGMKRYRRLDTIIDGCTKDNMEMYIKQAKQIKNNFKIKGNVYLSGGCKLSGIQRRSYARVYRRCKAKLQPFKYHSAGLQKEIRKLHKMQEEYLFVINNDVKRFEDFLELRKSMDELTEEITKKQKELYRNRSVEKRECRTIDEWKNFVNGEEEYHHQLAEIANYKKYVKQQRRILDRCIYREINKSEIGRELLLNQVIPDEDLLEDLSMEEDIVVPIYDEKRETVLKLDTAEDINKRTQADTDITDVELPKDRESYIKLTDKEKVMLFYQLGCDMETIADKVTDYLKGIEFSRYSGDVMDEVFTIQNKFEEISSDLFVKNEIQKVIRRMEQMGMPTVEFVDMDISQKISLFDFQNIKYSDGIKVYRGVFEKLGYDLDIEKLYEEYDRLYDESNRKGGSPAILQNMRKR